MKTYIEIWGISKIEYFYNFVKNNKFDYKYKTVENLFNSKKIYIPIFLSFFIGAILTFPIIFFEIIFYKNMNLENIILFILISLNNKSLYFQQLL